MTSRQTEPNQHEALRQAVDEGLADVDSGRYVDLADDDLEGFIAELGRRAARASSEHGPRAD